MEKIIAYKMSIEEAEHKLQEVLDDTTIKLVHDLGDIHSSNFFFAKSDIQCLDGAEIDERLAQILKVEAVEHYATDDGGLLAVVIKS